MKPFLLALILAAPCALAQTPLHEAPRWIHGVQPGQPCGTPLQVHAAGPGVFILRENKCVNEEAPFLYLILGEKQALLLDSGAEPGNGTTLPLRATLDRLIGRWEAQKRGRKLHLLVAHTHGHGDHHYLDEELRGRPDTEVVGISAPAVQAHFGFTKWPEGEAEIDLGGRSIAVLPLPGHEVAHLAFYDRRSGTVFSGDTLYPGLLTVRDWPAYRRSVARLLAFTDTHPVTYFAGAHVEMMDVDGQMYPLGTRYQPHEHRLFLKLAHLRELHAALEAQGDTPAALAHDAFIVEMVTPN